MPVGRPRTVSLPPAEMEVLGSEMVKWVSQHQPLHLSEWYTIHRGYTYSEFKSMVDCPEFSPYYERALKIIAARYLNGDVHPSIAQRWLRVYFKDLREEEDSTKDADAARAKENTPTVDPKTGELVEALLRQVAELQKIQSAQKAY
jgi:hypothetical protein